MLKAWIILIIAIVFEVLGTTMMKLSNGFTVLLPSILIFVFYAVAFTCLVLTLKKMDLSLAYAIWAGVGSALVAVIGLTYFSEPVTAPVIIGILMVIAGVVLIKMSAKSQA